MKSPWAFQNGLSYDDLELPAQNPQIHIGNSVLVKLNSTLYLKQVNIISFPKFP